MRQLSTRRTVNIILLMFFILSLLLFIWDGFYDTKHTHEEICAIIYQNDPKVNYQKYCDIKFSYKNKIYTTTLFHSYVDLNKTRVAVNIHSDNNGEVYDIDFVKYK